MFQREIDIGHAHLHQALDLVFRVALRGPRQRIAKHDKAFRCNFRQQSLFIFEMTVGSRYAHARQAGGIAQSKTLDAMFLDQRQRGTHQGCAQVSVMIGAFFEMAVTALNLILH